MRQILIVHHQEEQLRCISESIIVLFPDSHLLTERTGEKAFLSALDSQPDVILLTGALPTEEGVDLVKKLKTTEISKQIPIMQFPGMKIGGEAAPQLKVREGDPDADIILSYPVNREELGINIRTLLRLRDAQEIENELRHSEEKYRQLVHASNDGIYLLYNRKFEIVNKKFQEMFDVTPGEVNRLDFDFMELVAPKSRAFIEERHLKIRNGETVESKYEFTALSRKGKELEIEASISTVKYKDGMAVQGVVRDITERKNIERQLRQTQKIEAISRLAGGIAHDFNNILSIIRGYTELSMDDVMEGSLLYRNLHHVLSASDRAKDLVNQILTFSRQSEEERQPVVVSLLIHETLRILQPSIPTYIEVRVEIEAEDGIVMANPTQIRQILMNLCSNALHAMRETGGVLEVTLKKERSEQEELLKLTVSDTGHGMTQDVAERIFDPYFTTKATGAGSGMGLSVILGIVKKHGGDIKVESEPDKGTVFSLYLPERKSHIAIDSEPEENVKVGKERILFVDDEKMLVYMQQEILERLGYEVIAVSNSIEALDMFKNDPEIFDLVITDQSMPGLTGIQLARELIRIRPDIPIILCTGFSETVTRQDALKIGVKEFIIKPIIKREIAGVIRKVLRNNRIEKEE